VLMMGDPNAVAGVCTQRTRGLVLRGGNNTVTIRSIMSPIGVEGSMLQHRRLKVIRSI
jgi:hypothetical protein